MYFIDTSTAVPNQPDTPPAGKPGWFAQPSPGSGIAPTAMSPEWANMQQAELINLILGAGLTPNKGDQTQVLQAVRSFTNGFQQSIGFTPIQQGGGASQRGDKVYIGWDGTGLRVQVNSTDFGDVAFRNYTDATYQVKGNYQAAGNYQPALGFTPVKQGTTDQITITWDNVHNYFVTTVNNAYTGVLPTRQYVDTTFQPMLGFNPVSRAPVFSGDPDFSVQLGYSQGYVSYKINNDPNATGLLTSKAYTDGNFLNYNTGGTVAGDVRATRNIFANASLLSGFNSAGNAVGYDDRATVRSEFAIHYNGIGSYMMLPGGYCLQQFGFSLPSNGYNEFYFPTGFSQMPFAVVGIVGTDGDQGGILSLQAKDSASFKARLTSTNGTTGGANGCSGFAIGKI